MQEALLALSFETSRLKLHCKELSSSHCQTRVPTCRTGCGSAALPSPAGTICQERQFWKQPNPTDSFARVLLFLWDRMREQRHSRSESQAPMTRPRFWFHRPPKGGHHGGCESWAVLMWCCWHRACGSRLGLFKAPQSSAPGIGERLQIPD